MGFPRIWDPNSFWIRTLCVLCALCGELLFPLPERFFARIETCLAHEHSMG